MGSSKRTPAVSLKLNGGQASTIFVASSYSAELLAPAYLKEISVDGGATLTAAGQSGSLPGCK